MGAQARALTFDFTYSGGMDSNAIAGFVEAGQLWSSVLTDNVTVHIQIGYQSLDPGIIAQTSSTLYSYSYAGVSSFRDALAADATSSYDSAAVASLPTGVDFPITLNYVTNRYPEPAIPPTPLVTTATAAPVTGFGNVVIISQANLRALGNPVNATFTLPDASIVFSSGFDFDFSRTGGIDAGKYDFVGAAAHEIGHALGFTSSADAIDANAAGSTLDIAQVDATTLDLFRYSAIGVRDMSAGVDAYFSYTNGATSVGDLSTGVNKGDGAQASHWADNMGLGIMDPTLAPGETEFITTNDLIAFDVIGWDVAQFAAVPEPATTALLVAGGALGLGFWRRRLRRA